MYFCSALMVTCFLIITYFCWTIYETMGLPTKTVPGMLRKTNTKTVPGMLRKTKKVLSDALAREAWLEHVGSATLGTVDEHLLGSDGLFIRKAVCVKIPRCFCCIPQR